MNKNLAAKLIALAAFGFVHGAEATTLSVVLPNNTNVYSTAVGSFFDANIYVDGLPDFAGFDFGLTYNSTNLSAQSLTSGSIFGADTVSFANTISPGVGGAGSIHFAESLSDTSAATVGLNIAAPTLLGTIHFKALNISANNVINIVNPPLIYSYNGTSLGGTLQAGSVSITAAPAAVPLPASAFLFVPGLFAALGFRKNNARKSAV